MITIEDLVIVAATNRIEDIDMAIQRRFDIKVYLEFRHL